MDIYSAVQKATKICLVQPASIAIGHTTHFFLISNLITLHQWPSSPNYRTIILVLTRILRDLSRVLGASSYFYRKTEPLLWRVQVV